MGTDKLKKGFCIKPSFTYIQDEKKGIAKPTDGESTPQYTQKKIHIHIYILYDPRTSEAWSKLMKKDAHNVHLELNTGICTSEQRLPTMSFEAF